METTPGGAGEPPRPPLEELVPHFTQTPDVVYDFWMPLLSGAEFKVVSYVLRKTYGWRKRADAIPLSQFVDGQRARDGHVIDQGTGLSRAQVVVSTRVLVAAGILIKAYRLTDHEGDTAPAFRLNLAWDQRADAGRLVELRRCPPPADPPHGGVQKLDPGGVQKLDPGGVQKLDPLQAQRGGPETGPGGVQFLDPPQTALPETYRETAAATNREIGEKGGSVAAPAAAPRAACGAAAAALLTSKKGDGTTAEGEERPAALGALLPNAAALETPPELTREQGLLVNALMELSDDMSATTAEAWVRRFDRDLMEDAIKAAKKQGDLDNPAGWLKRRLEARQKERGERRANPASAVPAPPPPPPLRIAPYRPPAQEPAQTPGQIAADLRRVVDDPELAEWARMELWQRIRRLEDRQEALRRGELP